jgi:hypothetical protein
MSPIETVLDKLPGAKKSGNGWSARCPAHDDRKASLSLSECEDGRVLAKCHAGCDTSAILSAVGLTIADLFPQKASAHPNRNGKPKLSERTFPTANAAVAELERRHGKRSAAWTYRDAQGEPAGLVVRWDAPDGKEIRPVSWHRDGWRIGAMPEPRPLYCLPELAKTKLVIVAEGEKAADAADTLGFTATTSAGGSQAPGKTDWRPLSGKEVWILPDNDAPGRKYADTVAGILAKLKPAPVVRVIELPGLPDGADIVEWIEAHGDAAEPDGMRAEIEALAQAAEPRRPGDADNLTYRPFPVDALPVRVREFVAELAAATGNDRACAALAALVVLAGAVGNRVALQVKRGWVEPAILWGAIVARPGTTKSAVLKLATRALVEMYKEARHQFAEDLATYEAERQRYEVERDRWKTAQKKGAGPGDPPAEPEAPTERRLLVSDVTCEKLGVLLHDNPLGLLLVRDELAAWIGAFDRYASGGKGSDAPAWLSFFDSAPVVIDCKSAAGTIFVERASVSVLGSIQPGTLRRVFGAAERESGLLARLLLVQPPLQPVVWTDEELSEGTAADWANLLRALMDIQPGVDDQGKPRPRLIPLAPDAKPVYVAWHDAHGRDVADIHSDDLAAHFAKLKGICPRLALLFVCVEAVIEGKAVAAISRDHIERAIAVTDWFKHEARRVYAMLAESDAERDQRRLADWIWRKGGTVTAREVQQGCRWLREPGTAEAALEELVKAERGTWRIVPTTAKGGRPAMAFTLSTPSTVNETPAEPEKSEGSVDVDGVDAPKDGDAAGKGQNGLFGYPTPAGPYHDGF